VKKSVIPVDKARRPRYGRPNILARFSVLSTHKTRRRISKQATTAQVIEMNQLGMNSCLRQYPQL